MKTQSKADDYCILCNHSPEEGMEITGIKIIKGKEEPYSLCKTCCTPNKAVNYDAITDFRKNLWLEVDKKIRLFKKP